MTDSIVCTLGQYDIPIIQMQPPFKVDLLDSNIAVFGSSMNGKTNFVRLLINILHKIRNEKNEQIFILDFGGALSAYERALKASYHLAVKKITDFFNRKD